MKSFSLIVLLSVILAPIFWSGLTVVHYLVEHTHVFCLADADHVHKSSHECLDIYHISQDQDKNHLLTKIEWYESKQYITTSSSLDIRSFADPHDATYSRAFLNHGRLFSDDIFYPPIG